MMQWLFLLLALGLVGCGNRKTPVTPLDLTAEGTWERLVARRESVSSLRAKGKLVYASAGEESSTVSFVIVADLPEHFAVDLLDPFGRSAVTLLANPDGTWIRSRKRVPVDRAILDVAAIVRPGDLVAMLLGLPPVGAVWTEAQVMNPGPPKPIHVVWSDRGNLGLSVLRPGVRTLLEQALRTERLDLGATYDEPADFDGFIAPSVLVLEVLGAREATLTMTFDRIDANPELPASLFDPSSFEPIVEE